MESVYTLAEYTQNLLTSYLLDFEVEVGGIHHLDPMELVLLDDEDGTWLEYTAWIKCPEDCVKEFMVTIRHCCEYIQKRVLELKGRVTVTLESRYQGSAQLVFSIWK